MANSFLVSIKSTFFWIALISIFSLSLLVLGLHNVITFFGVYPRNISHGWSIFTSVLVHASYSHYLSNMTVLVVLLFISYLSYNRKIINFVIIELIAASGIFIWLFARKYVGSSDVLVSHLGASSLIYGLISFLIFGGIFSSKIKNIIISIIVAAMYGSQWVGMFPSSTRIDVSWEAHLGGAVAGLLLAYVNREYLKEAKKTDEVFNYE